MAHQRVANARISYYKISDRNGRIFVMPKLRHRIEPLEKNHEKKKNGQHKWKNGWKDRMENRPEKSTGEINRKSRVEEPELSQQLTRRLI